MVALYTQWLHMPHRLLASFELITTWLMRSQHMASRRLELDPWQREARMQIHTHTTWLEKTKEGRRRGRYEATAQQHTCTSSVRLDMLEMLSARDTQVRPNGTSTRAHRSTSSSARWMAGASSVRLSQTAPYASTEQTPALSAKGTR